MSGKKDFKPKNFCFRAFLFSALTSDFRHVPRGCYYKTGQKRGDCSLAGTGHKRADCSRGSALLAAFPFCAQRHLPCRQHRGSSEWPHLQLPNAHITSEVSEPRSIPSGLTGSCQASRDPIGSHTLLTGMPFVSSFSRWLVLHRR